jgi:hypothetical protein
MCPLSPEMSTMNDQLKLVWIERVLIAALVTIVTTVSYLLW